MSVWRRFDHGFPSLLTTNVLDREPIFRNPAAAGHLLRIIGDIQREERFNLIAYVIMPDHLHLVVWPRAGGTTGRIMKMIKGRFAREFQLPTTRRGPLWQSRYHERALTTEEALWSAVEYVHLNPVAAGLVQDPAEYRWSSVRVTTPAPVRLET